MFKQERIRSRANSCHFDDLNNRKSETLPSSNNDNDISVVGAVDIFFQNQVKKSPVATANNPSAKGSPAKPAVAESTTFHGDGIHSGVFSGSAKSLPSQSSDSTKAEHRINLHV